MKMSLLRLLVTSCATNEDGYTNKAFVNPNEKILSKKHVLVAQGLKKEFLFTLAGQSLVKSGEIAFNSSSRKWASLQTNTCVDVRPAEPDLSKRYLSQIQVYADYLTAKYARDGEHQSFDTADMSRQFTEQFYDQAFSIGQLLTFVYCFEKRKFFFELKIKSLEAIQTNTDDFQSQAVFSGLCTSNSCVCFEKSPDSSYVLSFSGDSTGGTVATQILNPKFDYGSLGIGGLSEEFTAVFRRAFASRLFPPKVAKQFNLVHVRGLLLYGPPGTGKTLLARQIGYMLNSRQPKIISAPEIMNKFVGESEANVRRLFAEAEDEQKKSGERSGLHIIIIDEIDAICKSRNTAPGGASSHTDSVINQLLAKMDGVDALDNILLIGMTNRRDLIDEALLRPGRFEVQVEIGLPSEMGRRQILDIHTKTIRENGKLMPDVDLDELARITKNFSGAELAGLVRAATSIAFHPVVNVNRINPSIDELEGVRIRMGDFLAAIKRKDIVPAFGASDGIVEKSGAIILWDQSVQDLLQECAVVVEFARTISENEGRFVELLLHGPRGSGLTTLAATIAVRGDFPFIRCITQADLNGLTEIAKLQKLQKIFDDAGKSAISCIILDSIHLISEYSHIGPRFSTNIINFIRAICEASPKKGHNLVLIATCSDAEFVQDLNLRSIFMNLFHVSNLSGPDHLNNVLEHLSLNNDCPFDQNQCRELLRKLDGRALNVGIKYLLRQIAILKASPKDDRLDKFLEAMELRNYIIEMPYG